MRWKANNTRNIPFLEFRLFCVCYLMHLQLGTLFKFHQFVYSADVLQWISLTSDWQQTSSNLQHVKAVLSLEETQFFIRFPNPPSLGLMSLNWHEVRQRLLVQHSSKFRFWCFWKLFYFFFHFLLNRYSYIYQLAGLLFFAYDYHRPSSLDCVIDLSNNVPVCLRVTSIDAERAIDNPGSSFVFV